MHCVVHIGIEKTGSTAIQGALESNRACLDEAGFLVGWPAHYGNSRYVVASFRAEPDDYWDLRGWKSEADRAEGIRVDLQWLEDAVNGAEDTLHTVILSSEHFHSRLRDEAEMAQLRDYLFDLFDQVTIVCYLRPQGSARTSLYSTAIRVGFIQSLRSFSRSVARDGEYFDYAALLAKWQRVFADSAFVVRPYWSGEEGDFDVRADFFTALGIDPTRDCVEFTPGRENSALTWPQLWAMRSVNVLSRGPGRWRIHPETRARLARRIEESPCLSRGPTPRPHHGAFTDNFRKSNQVVTQNYGIPADFWDHA